MKSIKLLSLALAILLSLSLFACDSANVSETSDITDSVITDTETASKAQSETQAQETEEASTAAVTETETETEIVTEYVEKEAAEDFVSFSNNTTSFTAEKKLSGNASYATSFTIPDGYMTSLSLFLETNKVPTKTQLVIRIYKFDGNYESSVQERPLRTEYVDSVIKTYTIWFGRNKMPAGDYLVELSSTAETEEDADAIRVGTVWLPNTLPEEYEQYDIKPYVNGKATKKGNALLGGFTYMHDVPVKEDLYETVTEKDPENTAKVIVLSGQSNAVGSSYSSFLLKNAGQEEYDKYKAGFPNVKILYSCTATGHEGLAPNNKSDEFVPVKLGQGYNLSTFGPEVGLASYLSEAYPDETFYIIKHAIGGASMTGFWNLTVDNPDSLRGLNLLKEEIDLGLSLLEDEGLDPKIVAFLWMQGESDSGNYNVAYNYYKMQTALAADIRTQYADYASVRGIAFVDAGVSDSGYWSFYSVVNHCKRQFARDSHLNYFIDTNAEGLTTLYDNDDIAHYDATSMIWLGELFGQCVSEAID